MHPHDPRRPGPGFGSGPGYQPPGYRPQPSARPGGAPPPPRRDTPRDAPRPPSGPGGRGGRAVQVDPVLAEIVAGLVWVVVGTVGIDNAGFGTLLLAAGIGVAGWVFVENRRQGPVPFDPARSAELLRLAGGAVVAVVVVSILFGLIGWGVYVPGIAALVTGGALTLLSRSTGQRPTLWLGIAEIVLGLLSLFVATQSAAGIFSQGVVGLLAGVLLLVSAADRVGLLEMLRDRYR